MALDCPELARRARRGTPDRIDAGVAGAAVIMPLGQLIYSNFGPGMTVDTDPTHGWTINGFLGPA